MKNIELQSAFKKLISGIFTVSCLSVSLSCESQKFADKDTGQLYEFSIKNDRILLKQDLVRGGTISWLSEAKHPRNLVNIADEGRYIQQSYYAGKAVNRQAGGQSPAWSPWSWNPIQAGDYAGNRARILDKWQTPDSTYIKCIPMLWDMDNKPAQACMEQWTTLQGNTVMVRCRLTCHRTDDIYGEGIANDQEIPAVYLISALGNLYSYFGNTPFAGEPVENTEVVHLEDGFWGIYDSTTRKVCSEKWMAFVDESGWGVGVYSPMATKFLAGMFGQPDKECNDISTGYIAPVYVEKLMKNSVFDYHYYLIVGTLDEIRSSIYRLHLF
ncbi:MAG: hypothetical protein LBF62_03215 [Tannerellaceae bacterium]|jgi:hypothetical protein|nr:hypothetical protein [Tannerellaceae bacterium]